MVVLAEPDEQLAARLLASLEGVAVCIDASDSMKRGNACA